MSDEPRQDGAGTHVGATEPDASEQESSLAAGLPEPDVAGHRKDGAGAGANTLDRGDDRLRAASHRPDQVTRHSSEPQQSFAIHFGQRADDLMDIAARAKIAARAANDDDLHL